MKKKITLIIAVLLVILGLTACSPKKQPDEIPPVVDDEIVSDIKQDEVAEETTSSFNFEFLKLENQKENKIYSPLSIKYALKMLEEGTSGESKTQISKLLGNQTLTKYATNENMSLANALFIRDTFSTEIKDTYVDTLKNNYDAEVISDSFESPKAINSWIAEKTLNLIKEPLQGIDSNINYILINALGIDMEWKNKFLVPGGEGWSYSHETYYGRAPEQVSQNEFGEDKKLVSGMEIMASINNYDIINELGRENIIQTVSKEYIKWAKELDEDSYEYSEIFNNDLSDENIQKHLDEFLYPSEKNYNRGYLEELNSNYGRTDFSTDFSLYVDDEVKVFAKDLKEYDGTTLQYIGIMPKNEALDSYVEKISEEKINDIINNLKELKTENFKQGVVTEITGYIPKFNFEYELSLLNDLNELGVTDVFTEGKANLTEITNNQNDYIANAIHQATIEFTQDGIKAAAVTMFAGIGAGDSFDYLYNVPIEKIDLTFDKPYMFLIRDKETNEMWFVGTVYEPLLWENEPENDAPSGT